MSKGRYVDIFVEPDANAPSGYAFRMEEGGVRAARLVFDKHQDNMPKSEDYKIEFKLHNSKGAKLRFSHNKEMVLWATEVFEPKGDECPPPGSSFEGLYVDPTAYPQDRVLTVINTDLHEQFFAFALNFVPEGTVEGPDTNYVCYDPIGENRNGGFGLR
jgi:hypothetical protein